jgi:hypothetical protein
MGICYQIKQSVYSTHPVIASLDHPLYYVKKVLNALFMRSKERADQRSVVGESNVVEYCSLCFIIAWIRKRTNKGELIELSG